jgi:hypothetical protein
MQRLVALVAFVFFLALASIAEAQPGRGPLGPSPGRETPQATVVTQVNVDVETEVHVSKAARPAAEDDDEDEEDDDDAEKPAAEESAKKRTGLMGLLEAASRGGRGIQVLTEINIDVETKVIVTGDGPDRGRPAEANRKPASEDEASPAKPQPDRPGERRRKGKKKRATSAESSAPTNDAGDVKAGLSLKKLAIGENVELGLAGQVSDERKAQSLADQINLQSRRALLGISLLAPMVPDQAESIGVLQKALSSVNAEASGKELSVSAAIPRETPEAIRTLVKEALSKEPTP